MRKGFKALAGNGSTMVEHSTAYPEIDGSNPTTAQHREINCGKDSFTELDSHGSTMVEHSTAYPEINCSNPATAQHREINGR